MSSDVVITIISLVLTIPALWYASRFNMHMLQLNTYLNNEHFDWMNDNLKKIWLLFALTFVGVLQICFQSVALDIISWVFIVLTLVIFRAMRRIYSKKPLHFTARVKRMFITDYLLCAIVIAITYAFFGLATLPGALSVACGAQMFMVPFANVVNKPIEKAIRNKYIDEAKAILEKCENLTVIGVTGSYGKTSVKFYLGELLSSKYNVLVTPESYNTPMGIVKTIRQSLTSSHDIFVCEMGARYVGEIKEICDIVHPDHGIITSIGPAHLSTFGSLENIQKTKFELADALSEGGKLFVNIDSELVEQELSRRDAQGVGDNAIAYSAQGSWKADYLSSIIEVDEHGTNFECAFKDQDFHEFHTRLVGVHNVINLTGAIAVANTFGCSFESLSAPMRKLKPVPHRMELKPVGDTILIDDAFNSNPVGSKAAVETLCLFEGVRILVTPGMVELGDEEEMYNYQFGIYAAASCDWIVLVGKKRTLPIKNGALSAGFDMSRIQAYNTFEEAINFAYKIDCAGQRAIILLENDLPDNYYSAA